MIPVFIGYDPAEPIAYHVLAHSLQKHSSEPLAICPVGNTVLPPSLWWRQRGTYDSTEFSNARFIVPALTEHRGWAIFMDCDMVALGDIAEVWAQRDDRYAVRVVKHEHFPTEKTKFLGQQQTTYARKNWSSMMLLNCEHRSALTASQAHSMPGLWLHGFDWCHDDEIGDIHGLWNVLVTPGLEHPAFADGASLRDIRCLHYTNGGPWHGYQALHGARWWHAYEDMVAGQNPCARFSRGPTGSGIDFIPKEAARA